MTLDLRLLGGFQLAWRGETLALGSARARALLARLALHAGEPQARALLAPLFWPDSTDAQARTNLRRLLHELWQILPDPARFLATEGADLTWRADAPATLDVAEFAALARRTEEPAALARAVALYRGDLLPECYDDWIAPERERLRDLFARALTAGIALGSAAGDWPVALAYANRLVELDPLNEEAHRQRLQIHLRRGDRSAAIRAYQECAALLERELGVAPSAATRALYEAARRPEPAGQSEAGAAPPATPVPAPAPLTPPRPSLTLPPLPVQPTPILGRARETSVIGTLLRRAHIRVVTLTGPGGIGKTRLALHAATAIQGEFADGVAFISLASVADPDRVVPAIARVLGATALAGQAESAALVALLRDRQVLLVLDNLEQVVAAVPALAEFLATCPGLKLLATSRVALQMRGEHEFLVSPLPLPEPGEARTLADLAQFPATALFLERAQAADQRFAPSDADAPDLAAICRRLDGLPLAIELAAPRTKLLALTALLARLDSRLSLLTGGARDLPTRQQTLRATLDWSHALLTPDEQRLLAHLAVFEGGGTLAAIEAICAEASSQQSAVLDSLAALNNQSLVRRQDADEGDPRFRMLELIREYAGERLAARGEVAVLRARHARYYLALAEELGTVLASADQVARQRRLAAEEDNLRAALRWASEEGEIVVGLRLASALMLFWGTRGTYREGRTWLDGFLNRSGPGSRGEEISPALHANALFSLTMMDWRIGDYPRARADAEQALALYRALGQGRESALTLRIMANIAMIEGRNDDAQALLDEAEGLVRARGHHQELALILNTQGELARAGRGDYAQAERYYREALSLSRASGPQEVATYLSNLGIVVLRRGDAAEALRLHREGLELRIALGHRRGFALCLEYFGAVAISFGQFLQAARYFGAAEALREELNSPRSSDPADDAEHRHYLAIAEARADPATWATALAEGRALPLDRVIAAALAMSPPRPGAGG